jgi:hypothetical protein
MKLTTLTPPLQALHDSSDDILLVSLISSDGMPVVHIGEGLVHIPAHRDHPFRLNVTACSGRS